MASDSRHVATVRRHLVVDVVVRLPEPRSIIAGWSPRISSREGEAQWRRPQHGVCTVGRCLGESDRAEIGLFFRRTFDGRHLAKSGRRRPRYATVARNAAPPPEAPARRYVIECKILRGSLDATIREGVDQTLDYVDKCHAESGHLVIFDRDESKPWAEKLYRREESLGGRPVTVWGA